jgi:hypothetical protein
MALGSVVALHWGQFIAIFGAGIEIAGFSVEWKHHSLPDYYVSATMSSIVIFEFFPYVFAVLISKVRRPVHVQPLCLVRAKRSPLR